MSAPQIVGLVVLLGLLSICVGVGLLFGYAWALIAWGVLSVAVVLMFTYRRGPGHE